MSEQQKEVVADVSPTATMKEEEHKEVVEELDAVLEAQLQTDPATGLTDEEVAQRLAQWGKNGF